MVVFKIFTFAFKADQVLEKCRYDVGFSDNSSKSCLIVGPGGRYVHAAI